ncbi:AAA family ATPase [Microbacterium hominis]|uniref:AAA family ATPase n=1 Tax=Microbacterium hominis TaxID=162426 RepID=A0A7D4QCA8_9MICO|nr:AAA family ATPase [Microbacterium hominis]QKJ19177.1 AAA family ATPase [Microbacterium hominis]
MTTPAPSTEDGTETPEEAEEREYQRMLPLLRGQHRARREVEREAALEAEWSTLHAEAEPDADPSTTGYPMMTLDKLRARPKPQWKIEGLIAESSICVIGGPTNIGKTFVGVDLTAHIALGLPWEGHNVVQGRVGYLIAEGSEFFPDRVAAWEQYNERTVPKHDYLVHDGEDFNLSDPAAVQRMCVTVVRKGIDVLVIDTLSQLGGLLNENDNVQMATAVKAAVRIRRARPGCTVVIMHHANAGGLLRGAKALWADVDTVLMLVPSKKPQKDEAAEPNSTFVISTEFSRGGKQRNAATVTIPGWHLEDVGPSKVAVRMAMTHDPYQAHILAVLVDGEEHKRADFAEGWDDPSGAWSDERYETAMKKLIGAGAVVRTGKGNGTKYRKAEQS